MESVNSDSSIFVMAGPGAGKTELLAQRAAFLFQTGLCPSPRRILAISFKRDAARNLAERVQLRCSEQDARRFTSLTFDAFAKGILDRFGESLPEAWKPHNYEVAKWNRKDWETFLSDLDYPAFEGGVDQEQLPKPETFESEHLGAHRLPINRSSVRDQSAFAAAVWWERTYVNIANQTVSFTMINRLAEATQRLNPQVQSAIRSTFPFIFIDEFQDTTYAQFDLLQSVFANSDACLTAVGDNKQRIMVWAGARVDAFDQFKRLFKAQRKDLTLNWRSSEELVRIQEVVSWELDEGHVPVESRRVARISQSSAQIWLYSSRRDESDGVSSWIANDIVTRATSPNDYAVLVRQKPGDFEGDLRRVLRNNGIRLRNEAQDILGVARQDLLASSLSELCLPILKLIVRGREPVAWSMSVRAACRLRAVEPDDEPAIREVQNLLSIFLREWFVKLRNCSPNADRGGQLGNAIIRFLNPAVVVRCFAEYRGLGTFVLHQAAFCEYLRRCASVAQDWTAVVDEYEGSNAVSLLTMHKSKGLEYDTVIMQGLDDSTWWSHDPENPEGLCTLFVALSRAKERVIFTHCSSRGELDGVADLYDLLVRAEIPVIDHRVDVHY